MEDTFTDDNQTKRFSLSKFDKSLIPIATKSAKGPSKFFKKKVKEIEQIKEIQTDDDRMYQRITPIASNAIRFRTNFEQLVHEPDEDAVLKLITDEMTSMIEEKGLDPQFVGTKCQTA
jgi:hypothetical protein